MRCETIDEAAALEPLRGDWEALAAAAGLPMSGPAWMLAWWRHMRPPGARLRVVAVHDTPEGAPVTASPEGRAPEGAPLRAQAGRQAGRERLVAVAPFFVVPPRRRSGRIDYRLLSAGHGEGLTPLAAAGAEVQAAALIARALAESEPRPDLIAFEATPSRSAWPELLRGDWPPPGAPAAPPPTRSAASIVSLDASSFDDWLARLPSKTRAEARRRRRRMEEAGGTVRWSTAETIAEDLETVMRLHVSRWEEHTRGGPGASSLAPVRERALACFAEIGEHRLADGGLRVQLIEIAGEAISAHIILACGDTIASLNGGWDERYGALSPPTVRVLETVADGIRRGERRLSLGNGQQPYKTRFADTSEPLLWGELLTPGPRRLLARASLAPERASQLARAAGKRVLDERAMERLRALRSRRRAG